MNRQELVTSTSDATGVSKNVVNKVLDSLIENITSALKSGEDVRLVGFLTLSVRERAAMEGRNPRTGEKIKIPASKRVRASAGSTLIDAIN